MIDWERVQELRDEIGPDDFKEVVGLFMSEVEEVIARLRDCPDPNRLEEDFHFIKGSALNLGFAGLAELCGAGERHPEASDPAGVVARYEASRADFLAAMTGICAAA